jgi:hypothetical protein
MSILFFCIIQGGVMRRVYFKVIFIGIALVLSQVSYAGKKQCQSYLEKLRNVQSQQKQGHSLKRGESLNKLEAKAIDIWWPFEQCNLKKAKRIKKKKQSHKNKRAKQRSLNVGSLDYTSKVNANPFQTSAPLVLKSRFQGKKLQAWLLYYQQPKKCVRPKSTKQFAFCVENRREQQLAFEKNDAIVSTQ